MHQAIVQRLLSMFMKGAPTSEIVFTILGRTDKDLILDMAYRMMEEGAINAGRVVEIAREASVSVLRANSVIRTNNAATSL